MVRSAMMAVLAARADQPVNDMRGTVARGHVRRDGQLAVDEDSSGVLAVR